MFLRKWCFFYIFRVLNLTHWRQNQFSVFNYHSRTFLDLQKYFQTTMDLAHQKHCWFLLASSLLSQMRLHKPGNWAYTEHLQKTNSKCSMKPPFFVIFVIFLGKFKMFNKTFSSLFFLFFRQIQNVQWKTVLCYFRYFCYFIIKTIFFL